MDAYEATKTVMSRIHSVDPENAARILGYIMLKFEEKEMIKLACGPEALLLPYIEQAKAYLGLSTNGSPKSLTPLSNPIRPPFLGTSPRILIPNDGPHFSNPSSPATAAPFPSNSPRPGSYAAVLNASPKNGGSNNGSRPSSSLHFYGGNELLSDGGGSGPLQHQVQDQLLGPSGISESVVLPYGNDVNSIPSPHAHPHPDPFLESSFLEEGGGGGGFGLRPCTYFARGFCKNGSSCKFVHGDIGGGGETIELGSPPIAGSDEFLRMNALQQQRFALMASRGPFPYNQRNELSPTGLDGGSSSSLRQIYLTFPADSTFKEADVTNYFCLFGPVQDVRIPYQQKRMFGFVTFVYPETVKVILAKGNPHFVCGSRVLVKPYKEKGKVPDVKQSQQHLSPSPHDSRELSHLPVGPRLLLSPQEMMLRRKLEQEAQLQHAIELQGQRMMNLQLMGLENPQHNHRFLPISPPGQTQLLIGQNVIAISGANNQEVLQENGNGREASKYPAVAAGESSTNNNTVNASNNQRHANDDDFYTAGSLEHILPDNLFASPTKVAAEHRSIFSQADHSMPVTDASSNSSPVVQPSSSPLSMASLSDSQQTSIYAGQKLCSCE